jgi:hypothetical protein
VKHFDEHMLELFARNSDLIAKERKEIELHLSECSNCRDLTEQISQFYGALDTNLRGQLVLSAGNDEIVVARPEVAHHIRPAASRVPSRMWAFARQRPVVTALSTIGIVALVMAALNLFNGVAPVAQKDQNLFEVRANGALERLEAFNKQSDTLWTLPWFSSYQPSHNEQALGTVQAVVADPLNNGRRQLFSIIPGLGASSHNKGRVIVQAYGSEKNQIFAAPLGEDFAFNSKPFTMNFSGRAIVVDDFAGKGKDEIIVGADHYDSPSVIYRLDANGTVLGEYWHYGRISGIFTVNLKKDGSKQLLICGINDVLQRAILGVLDPAKIVGKSEASATPGFGFARSAAEEYYISFPSCDLWDLGDLPKPRVSRIVGDGERFDAFVEDTAGKGIFRYVFSSDMKPLRVTTVDNTRRNYEQLKKQGKLHGELNDTYFSNMRRNVRYWDGARWTAMNSEVLSPPR